MYLQYVTKLSSCWNYLCNHARLHKTMHRSQMVSIYHYDLYPRGNSDLYHNIFVVLICDYFQKLLLDQEHLKQFLITLYCIPLLIDLCCRLLYRWLDLFTSKYCWISSNRTSVKVLFQIIQLDLHISEMITYWFACADAFQEIK